MTEWVKHELPDKLRKFAHGLDPDTKKAASGIAPDVAAIEMFGDDFAEFDDTGMPNLWGEIIEPDEDEGTRGNEGLEGLLEELKEDSVSF